MATSLYTNDRAGRLQLLTFFHTKAARNHAGLRSSQQFAVYLYTFTSGGAGASQTFNFTIGTDNASADAASSLSSVTVASATPAWYTLGAFTQTIGLDTFKLRMDSNKSPTQGDVILIAAVPEPGTTGILLAFGTFAGLLRRRRA